MKYADIGGMKSSRFVLGSADYGERISEDQAFYIMDFFRSLGGNHIDTARLYTKGESERIVGKWKRTRHADDMIISTKGGHPELCSMHTSRLSEKELRRDLEESLSVMGVSEIDIYQLHRDDEKIPVPEIIEPLNGFIREGKIRLIGCSNWHAERINEANAYAASHGLCGFAASQIKYSAAVTSETYNGDDTLVEMTDSEKKLYKESGLPVIAYMSQARGFFSKYILSGENALSEDVKAQYLCEENIGRAEKIKELSEKYGISPTACGCAFLLSEKDFPVFPVIGGRNEEQIRDSLTSLNVPWEDFSL